MQVLSGELWLLVAVVSLHGCLGCQGQQVPIFTVSWLQLLQQRNAENCQDKSINPDS